ncbi:hypothetical protein QEJ31_00620 [Pigmentibacter sp. JX0631]|uniref:hypothetical protein n=1 Tax=Pigmentibacter sp. JX0631 TaxID=2976982 RepID=UPI002468E9AE|nr:hypothetical protein [Pigmentibacter sp. JX0631]WGL60105.1 hypothetical protein QEJ31_00620 [Pigmentibacter sp. JX0631]
MLHIFKEIHYHLKTVEKNTRLIDLLSAAAIINNQDEQISSLQKDFLITEVAFSYKHFGFSLFCPTSVNFIIKEISRLANLSPIYIKKWLMIVADLLLQELDPDEKERIFDNTSNILEEIFAQEFIKRIFCTEQEEDYLTGMSIFPTDFIDNIRSYSRNKISKITLNSNINHDDSVFDENEFFLDEFDTLKNSVFNFLNKLQEDPLSLLSWRLESFVCVSQKNNTLFLLKDDRTGRTNDPKKVMSIISLLVPHRDQTGNLLLPDSPISISQLAKIFSEEFKSDKFQVDIIKNWLNLKNPENIKKEIEFLLNSGVENGIFFKIPNGNKSFSYGLSDNGLKIIKPFHKVLTDTILIQNIDQF